MPDPDLSLNTDAAIDRLLRFLAIEGITGQEKAIGAAVVRELVDAGVPRSRIRFDRAHEKIPLPTETGNLIVTLSGTRPGPRRLFMTHLDTVPLCAGAQPVRHGGRIKPAGATALGGDNRTGVACLVTLVATLLERGLPHPPLTLLFTVREESGLWGARFVDPTDLGNPVEGFNVDGSSPSEITIGAVGADRWRPSRAGRVGDGGDRPGPGRRGAGRLVRQDRARRTRRDIQRRQRRRPRRSQCRRGDQRRHRLRLHQGREPQSQLALRQGHHPRLP
jgi:tripeptide aminopeptidase